jgi:uncharacterized protein YgfB (UPF0149 family)
MPDYDETAAAMQRAGLAQSPAEAHGFAVGLHLAGISSAADQWRHELYAELDPADVLAGECRRLLDRVFAAVAEMTRDHDGNVALLLPERIDVDSEGLGAVRDWGQGFLFGFGLGGEHVERGLSTQSREWLRDIAEIVRIDTDDVENSDENQAALIEIEEYLRVGVILLRDDLIAARGEA